MLKFVAALASFALVACSSSSPNPETPDQDAASTTAPACTISGATVCHDLVQTMCIRSVQCCESIKRPGESCPYTACLNQLIAIGYDCSSNYFTKKQFCPSDSTAACSADYNQIACSDLTAKTANIPPSCATFWAKFAAQ